MNIERTRRWGFILLFAGFLIGIPGILMLVAHVRYEATARIKVVHDTPVNDESYDPYFIQTEFEIIKSDVVLTNVIARLHLDEEWARRYNYGHPLEMSEVLGLLRQSLRIEPVSKTMLIDITFISEDPAEAANVANAIVTAYADLRLKQNELLTHRGIQALNEEQAEVLKQIDACQTNVNRLLIEKDSPTHTSEERAKKNQEFMEATNTLEHHQAFDKILEAKLASQPSMPTATQAGLVSVIEPAQTPTAPTQTNLRLGRDLLLAGVLMILAGIRLLWRAYFANPLA